MLIDCIGIAEHGFDFLLFFYCFTFCIYYKYVVFVLYNKLKISSFTLKMSVDPFHSTNFLNLIQYFYLAAFLSSAYITFQHFFHPILFLVTFPLPFQPLYQLTTLVKLITYVFNFLFLINTPAIQQSVLLAL